MSGLAHPGLVLADLSFTSLSFTGLAFALASLAALVLHLASAALALRHLARRDPTPPRRLPPVTLLRPVCGREAHDVETLGSSFTLNPAPAEVIFCLANPRDPAIGLLNRLAARHPDRPCRILTGRAGRSPNPKLDNLVKGWQAARTDRIVMADSNLLLPADYLSILAAAWDGRTGLVSSPAVGVRPEGLWARLECAFLNGNQARLQLASDALGQGFAQGKTLAFSRNLLERAGGLAALDRDLAEDAAATKAIRGLGLRVRLVPAPFAQPIGHRSLAQVWSRQLRWSRIRRAGFARLFLLEPLNDPVLPGLALAGAVAAGTLPAMVLPGFAALWYGAEAALARRAGWPAGPADLAASVLRDLMLPVLWLATFRARGFAWRGTAMQAAPLARR
jgi:ceramide glucosyltransferase